jgi:hypothetical protein
VTGTAASTVELLPKLLEFLHDLVPGARRVSFPRRSPKSRLRQTARLSRRSARPDDRDPSCQPARRTR